MTKKIGTLYILDDEFSGSAVFYHVESVTSYEDGKALLLDGKYSDFRKCVFEKDAFHVYRKFLKEHSEIDASKVDIHRLPYASEIKDYKVACYYEALEDMERMDVE